MAASTLQQFAGMPLGFEPDIDEADEPFLPSELPSLSLQHVLGLARVDEDLDPALEDDLKAELGVHGINVDEFQERLNAMLSSWPRFRRVQPDPACVSVRAGCAVPACDAFVRPEFASLPWRFSLG